MADPDVSGARSPMPKGQSPAPLPDQQNVNASTKAVTTPAKEIQFWQMVNGGQRDTAIVAALGRTVNAVATKRKRKHGVYTDAQAFFHAAARTNRRQLELTAVRTSGQKNVRADTRS